MNQYKFVLRNKKNRDRPPCPFCGYQANNPTDALFHIMEHTELK